MPGEQRPPIERAVSALRRAAGELVCSRPGRWLADAVAPLYRGASVRELPAWFGALNGIRVPRSVRPAPTATAASSANINIILDLLDETAGVPGQVAECGVFRGATLVDISPREQSPAGYPIYLRDHLQAKQAPLTKATRCVSPLRISW